MQLSELLIRGLSRIQKWPELYSDWHYVWEAGEGIQTQKTEKYLSLSLVSKPWKARTVARTATTRWVSPEKQVGSWFSSFRDLNLICRVSHEEKPSLIFMRDLPLKLTLDHQNVATKMAPASSYTRSCWWSLSWKISNQFKGTIKLWVRNRWTSFYRLVLYILQHIAAIYFTQSCRIA